MAAEREAIIGSIVCSNPTELLDKFHKAAETGNLRQYFGSFHPEGRFLGTDASENWHVNDFYDFSKVYFLRGSAWTYIPIASTRKFTYFPSEESPILCTFDELLESESFLATSRGSGTLVFDSVKGGWLIAQYHLSFPIPNDLAKDMTLKISLFEKAAKEQSAEEAARKLIEEWDNEGVGGSEKSGGKSGGKGKGKGKKK